MILIKGLDNYFPSCCTECWNCDKNFNDEVPKDKWVCLLLMKFADQSGKGKLKECPEDE